jgi:hypothetical protein
VIKLRSLLEPAISNIGHSMVQSATSTTMFGIPMVLVLHSSVFINSEE